jgi:N-acetylneuraminic acid mutarotase
MNRHCVLFLFLSSLVVSCMFTVHAANGSGDEWAEKASMPTGRYNFGAAVINGTIYAIGGITNIPERKSGHITTTINVNEAYDPVCDVWVEKAPMPAPHWLDSYGIAVWQNRIYCIGGPANNVYDPATDTWEAKTPMPTSRQFLTANIVDDKIYLIGGLALGPPPAWQDKLTNDPRSKLITYSESSLTEMYDPITDSWTEKESIPTAVDSYASVVIDKRIYVISGRSGGNVLGLVQVYDTQVDEWCLAAPIPTPVEGAAVCVMTTGNTEAVYVVGGSIRSDGGNATNLNQIYFPENNSWTTGKPMLDNMSGLSVVVVNDRLFAMGGISNYGYVATTYQYTPANLTETDSTTSSPEPSPSNETQNNPTFTSELSIFLILLTTTVISVITIRWKKNTKI